MRLSNTAMVVEWLDRETALHEHEPNGALAKHASEVLQSEAEASHIVKVLLGIAEFARLGGGGNDADKAIFDTISMIAAARVETREQLKAGNKL